MKKGIIAIVLLAVVTLILPTSYAKDAMEMQNLAATAITPTPRRSSHATSLASKPGRPAAG